jgi:hypothetical protein
MINKEKSMDKRTVGIIVTIASVLLCGIPGCCMIILGTITTAGIMPFNYSMNEISKSGTIPSSYGFILLCLALIFILIPVVVGVIFLRKKPEPAPSSNEPIPPPI